MPFTLAIIFVLLYLTFRNAAEAALMMTTLPFALVGGFWFIYLLGHHVSVAIRRRLHRAGRCRGGVRRGDADLSRTRPFANDSGDGELNTLDDLRAAIVDGAVLRVRPKAMTVAVIIAGLLPLFVGAGYRQRSDAAHRSADGRRHDHRAAAVDGRTARRVSVDAETFDWRFRGPVTTLPLGSTQSRADLEYFGASTEFNGEVGDHRRNSARINEDRG